MKVKSWTLFIWIASTLLVADWVLGAAQASGTMPSWIFALVNVPFGIGFVWFEAQWTGTYYSVFGHRMGDFGSLVVFGSVVMAQAGFYWWLLETWRGTKRYQSNINQHPTDSRSAGSHE